MVKEVFRMLGLTEKEEEIYLALLNFGPSNVADISQKTMLNRTFCYDLIEKMIKKGVIFERKSPTKVYKPVSLEQLKIILEKSYLESKKELESLRNIKGFSGGEVEILEFKGYYAVFNLFRKLISQKENINSFWSKKVGQLFQEFIEKNIKIRINNEISLKVLTDDNEWTKKWLNNFSFEKNYRQVKYLKDFDIDSMIYIFNEEVAIITYENNSPYGVLIKNKEYYETQIKIFNTLWKLSS